MQHNVLAAATLALALAAPAAKADPTVGAGITVLFGGGVAAGIKVFSNDRDERAALSLGLDYNFSDMSWRPNLGVAYLKDHAYLDLNAGFNLGAQELDFGAGLGLLCCGGTETEDTGGGGGGGLPTLARF